MWSWNFNLQSMITPKSFIDDVLSRDGGIQLTFHITWETSNWRLPGNMKSQLLFLNPDKTLHLPTFNLSTGSPAVIVFIYGSAALAFRRIGLDRSTYTIMHWSSLCTTSSAGTRDIAFPPDPVFLIPGFRIGNNPGIPGSRRDYRDSGIRDSSVVFY